MTKIYISVDIEGINGVVYPHQTMSFGGESYNLAVKQQHEEVNCVIEALQEANIDQITVNDAHYTMENLHISQLNPKIELITGKPKHFSMLAGLDESYDCVFLIGYHAKAGAKNGVLAHTFSPVFKSVSLNGDYIGEIELNSIYAGLLNVPIALVTGDNCTCEEAQNSIGNVKTVCTKTAISTTSARCKANEQLFRELKWTVTETVNNQQDWALYKTGSPYVLEVDFCNRKHADLAELLPELERLSATRVKYTSNEYKKVYKLLQFMSATIIQD